MERAREHAGFKELPQPGVAGAVGGRRGSEVRDLVLRALNPKSGGDSVYSGHSDLVKNNLSALTIHKGISKNRISY